jgi:TatA/E family protein of Tat protein translocase
MPGFIGMPELLLLGLVALILFGPKRLPEMGRGLGMNTPAHDVALLRLDV